MADIAVGESIPQDTSHAVSVSLPTWKANVGYEEGEQWVVSKMTTGYPRFFIHKAIDAFATSISQRYGEPGQKAMLFPTRRAADRCVEFMARHADPKSVLAGLKIVDLALDLSKPEAAPLKSIAPAISAVLVASEAWPFAKQYWQHSGDGVSSRRAEFCHRLLEDDLFVLSGSAVPRAPPSPDRREKQCRGPRRYQRPMSFDANTNSNGNPNSNGTANGHAITAHNGTSHSRSPNRSRTNGGPNPTKPTDDGDDAMESSRFLEERYGRNLDLSFVERAKCAIKRRIAGTLRTSPDIATTPLPPQPDAPRGRTTAAPNTSTPAAPLDEDDIYLFPCGMNAIFNAHRFLLSAKPGTDLKSINYGFPYVDTLKILQKFGPGCLFYGHASASELDDLESRLASGERFLALFLEFPGNPLLSCPDLARIRRLADKYHFAVVIDETIGTFDNVDVLPYADVIVSSLTKIFSGESNVMGGSAVLNPSSPMYAQLKEAARREFEEENYWPEDVIFMERNSRDFASRVARVNTNAEAICEVLLSAQDLVKRVYYPKHNPSPCKEHFDLVRLPDGGYGGLLSVTFKEPQRAVAWFDAVRTAKGPSLGTNFTLASPYVLLAHYGELEWAESLGVEKDLVRISVGLEDEGELRRVFAEALEIARGVDVGAKGA